MTTSQLESVTLQNLTVTSEGTPLLEALQGALEVVARACIDPYRGSDGKVTLEIKMRQEDDDKIVASCNIKNVAPGHILKPRIIHVSPSGKMMVQKETQVSFDDMLKAIQEDAKKKGFRRDRPPEAPPGTPREPGEDDDKDA